MALHLLEELDNPEHAEDAAVELGLLIERAEELQRGDEPSEAAVELFGQGGFEDLSDHELLDAVTGLIERVGYDDVPLPSVVWALGKSRRPEVLDALIQVLGRTMQSPEAEDTAYQAIVAASSYGDRFSRHVVEDAARVGTGRVSEFARDYLEADDGSRSR